MNLAATIANSLWGASNLPSHLRFRRALHHPETVQLRRLQTYLRRNSQTAFGKAHQFDSIHNYQDFARRVPLMDYESTEPFIERIRRGEKNVLTHDPVLRLVPTSGSSGARKLIPFTGGLQHEFNAAIGPWINNLLLQSPGIACGSAYWSITPVTKFAADEASAVPIGFDADTKYLGRLRERLARSIMAVPSAAGSLQNLDTFRHVTALCLLQKRDLRLISVWHPSFLALLLQYISANWDRLVHDLKNGRCRDAPEFPVAIRAALPPFPARANELHHCDPQKPESIWPHLKLISCWGDAAAESPLHALAQYFAHVKIQPKGLLATEAVVSIPFNDSYALAVTSHFYEFIDDSGTVKLAHELRQGQTYEVAVTTAGGLWRYRLGDQVRVTGVLAKTPSLKFIGRTGNVSDLAGEKLSEAFVAAVLKKVLEKAATKPVFVLLAPDKDATVAGYTLYIEGQIPPALPQSLDQALRENPHYAYCRDLGQLSAPRVFNIASGGYEAFTARHIAAGARLGEIKPAVLSKLSGWTNTFVGSYDPVSRQIDSTSQT